jgi:multiple sugar transport system substrate-binding protein
LEVVMVRWMRFSGVAVAAIVLAVISATGSAEGSPSALRGQTITVLVPYKFPQKLLKQFTAQTGIKVNYVVTGWDATKQKLIVANTAHQYIADVAEFDWSFTGQFSRAKWVEPLDSVLPRSLLKSLAHVDAAFTSGGHTYAVGYANDFRISLYNKKLFKAAGISSFPTTFAQLTADVGKLKSANSSTSPLLIPMGATEGGVTPWYLLTLAMGGRLFDNHWNPLFAKPGSAGYRALQWEVNAVKQDWVPPGSVTLDDSPNADKFAAGAGAILLAGAPGTLQTDSDPSQSSISDAVAAALVPGIHGPGHSFGLPEGLSIPTTAKNKDAAAKFIEWWEQPATAAALYKQASFLPCSSAVLNKLAASGKLVGGKVLAEELQHLVPLFPGGAPLWYSQFSSDAQGLLNAAVKGQTSVGAALSQLAAEARKLVKNS